MLILRIRFRVENKNKFIFPPAIGKTLPFLATTILELVITFTLQMRTMYKAKLK
jgi:hypothetical protein